ncbi:hypothetical protein [Streptomyces sp. NBC_00847]|uniref:hypothetical protein n=1 Tax=Streptomyces sp. NBC_00847 TaxID=2975850 RepID=UPI00224CB766|nr:hypothetical protein [Streptomyces sp. NBC_00847]MCX4882847.1 hypothetical protein [Streptomyces sp. NBC_00847]
MTSSRRTVRCGVAAAVATVLWASGIAHAAGPADNTTAPPARTPSGNANNGELSAAVSRIKVTQVSGPTGGKTGRISSTDVNWEPPPCWYEPVYTPEKLKDFSETDNPLGYVSPHAEWGGKKLWTDHYRDSKDAYNYKDNSLTPTEGYDNYNIGKNGYFWRGVARDSADPDSYGCESVMFWQDAGQIPKVANAPTPKTLAAYAYDKVKVPGTEIELRPTTKSTVNAPTWAWLDKGTFKEVKVRAELPDTGLWAETTAKPITLHLDPGTQDAETFPASGDCEINDDGSTGTPYVKGDAGKIPPCGITYLRATYGTPYHLKASITWQISWEGTGGAKGDLPDGTFDTTQDMNVVEYQATNS